MSQFAMNVAIGAFTGFVGTILTLALLKQIYLAARGKTILCSLFGHRPRPGYGRSEGNGYFEQEFDTTDGIRRTHVRLYATCRRCDERFQVGRIHLLTLQELIDREGVIRR